MTKIKERSIRVYQKSAKESAEFTQSQCVLLTPARMFYYVLHDFPSLFCFSDRYLLNLPPSAKNRTGENRVGQGKVGQGKAGQGRAGQGRAGQGRAGQGRAGLLH